MTMQNIPHIPVNVGRAVIADDLTLRVTTLDPGGWIVATRMAQNDHEIVLVSDCTTPGHTDCDNDVPPQDYRWSTVNDLSPPLRGVIAS